MDEQEEYNVDYYRLLEEQLLGDDIDLPGPVRTTQSLVPSSLEIEESAPQPENTFTSTDDYVCTCGLIDTDSQLTVGDEESEVELPPSPSELLYEQLVRHDYECQQRSDDEGTEDSRFTPDSVTENEDQMVPFKLRWSLGFTINSRLVNFSRDKRKEFFIATAHKGIIYNYQENTMRYTHGHIKPIKAAATDRSGHWLVTGGQGLKSKIIVSDTRKCRQLLIIDSEDEDMGAMLLGMAPDARWFISVHNIDNPKIKVWRWTYGRTTPDYEFTIGKFMGQPQRIAFHPNDQNIIMIAFEKQMFFCHWNDETKEMDEVVAPPHKKLGTLTDCVMAMNKHEVFASTVTGHIAIFGNVLYTEDFSEHSIDINKMFVKKIKVCRTGIVTMRCPDNILVTLEERGTVKFFDTNVLLLYWIEKELPPIEAISFSLDSHTKHIQKREMSLAFSKFLASRVSKFIDEEDFDGVAEYFEEDRLPEFETKTRPVKSRASLHHTPFICRDFIAGCKDGRIFHVNIMEDIFQPHFYIADASVASLCVSFSSHLLYVAYENGRVTIFNYEELTSIVTSTVLVKKRRRDSEEAPICNTFILTSNMDVHLVVARTNGEIIFMGPTLTPIPNQRYQYTAANIERMAFSENNQYLAFCDSTKTMYIVKYRESNWEFCTKYRAHHEPITDMLFLHYNTPRLYSISEDRYMVEYCVDPKEPPLKTRVKIEDTAIPLCFLYYPTPPNSEKFFLVANSEFKYKLINETTMKCSSLTVGPCLGCYETPVNKIKVLPNSHGKYLIFANHNHMGIQKTPLDGNPYKHIGCLANPKLGNISCSNDGKYLFTYAKGEGGILIWEINKNSLDILHYMGGNELEPYYCLIEGGANGWFFKEIEDMFCYMQILHQEDAYASQHFGNSIFISDLPDLIRACGFYPSDYEIQLLIDDIENRNIEKTGKKREFVTFVEFVKLFLNHRPAHGISLEDMQHSFDVLFDRQSTVEPHDFAKTLCNYGETFSENSISTCLQNLMSNTQVAYDEDILESLEPITFEYMTKTMLGILQESAYTEAQEKAIREAEEFDDTTGE